MTGANVYSGYSCLKLLQIDVITNSFSDKMLPTWTTPKNLENGMWCSKEYNVGAKMCFCSHKNDAQSVANGDRQCVEILQRYVSQIIYRTPLSVLRV